MLASLAGGRVPACVPRAPPASAPGLPPATPRSARADLPACWALSGPGVLAYLVGSRLGLPPPCATIACLPRSAPPTCTALHVEGMPSLRSGFQTDRRSRARGVGAPAPAPRGSGSPVGSHAQRGHRSDLPIGESGVAEGQHAGAAGSLAAGCPSGLRRSLLRLAHALSGHWIGADAS